MSAPKHDARVWLEIGPGRPKRPYGWACLHCPASGRGYATGEAAKRAAMRHNGGTYNEATPEREEAR